MIWQLTGGMILYSETPKRDHDVMRFKARETCFLVGQPQRGGDTKLQIQRADKIPWKMTELTVPMSAIAMFHDCTDQSILASIRSEMSGLIIPIAN